MTNPTNDFYVTINGLDVHARYSERAVREIFLPFLREMTDLHKRKKRRVLVMLAAPPGAGKSTLLAYLEKLSAETPGIEKIQTIGIDGFHRYQDYLLTHTAERGGEQIPMVKIKGAPVTFDLTKLTERVKKVAAGEV
ncbi:MAG: kinase, partial [Lachnospiraceae bacterium]|nr:kinase [Lachnospiraceae bacterium]